MDFMKQAQKENLVKIPEDQIREYKDQVSDCAFDNFMKYGVDISPVIKNEVHFNEWSDKKRVYWQNSNFRFEKF